MTLTTRLFVTAALLATAACSGSSGPSGGPVAGAVDTHCALPDGGVHVQTVNPASCHVLGDAGIIDYGATMYNSEADDDDCKYHLKFTSSGVYQNADVNFTLVATQKATSTPAAGARAGIEPFLPTDGGVHPPPNTNLKSVEGPAGTFLIGPVRFDAPGRWTVRFHLSEDCSDVTADSPHGHAAFFLDVP